jgi:hypothetical protein
VILNIKYSIFSYFYKSALKNLLVKKIRKLNLPLRIFEFILLFLKNLIHVLFDITTMLYDIEKLKELKNKLIY